MALDKYYSVEETAEILQAHPDTIRRYIRQKKLRAARIGKSYRVSEKDLQSFIESRMQTQEQE